MLNRDGIASTKYGNVNQILANIEMQASVGCIVSKSIGVEVNGKKIAKAGTPIKIDYMNRQTAATAGEEMNAVLLHDVDVTKGDANGTALIFGFVNVARVDADVAAKIAAVTKNDSKVTFLKF